MEDPKREPSPTTPIMRGNRGGAVKIKIMHARSSQSQKMGPTARHVPSNPLTRATEIITSSALMSSKIEQQKTSTTLVLARVFDSTKHSGATPIGSTGRAPYDYLYIVLCVDNIHTRSLWRHHLMMFPYKETASPGSPESSSDDKIRMSRLQREDKT